MEKIVTQAAMSKARVGAQEEIHPEKKNAVKQGEGESEQGIENVHEGSTGENRDLICRYPDHKFQGPPDLSCLKVETTP